MDRFVARFGEFVQPLTRIAVIAQGFVEFTIRFLFQQRQQGGRVDLMSPQRHIDLAVCTDAGRVNIDLNDFGIVR